MRVCIIVIVIIIAACKQNMQTEKTDFNYSSTLQQQAITYLTTKVASQGFGGKSICSTRYFGADSSALYLRYYCQEFYESNGTMQKGTGEAGPIALYHKMNDGAFQIISHKKPRDGNLYAKDIDVIFPNWAQKRIVNNQ